MDLQERAKNTDPKVLDFIKTLPKEMHSMTQLSMAVLYLQTQSKFSKAYMSGVPKKTLWEHAFEDGLNLIARIPLIAAYIYRHKYKDDKFIEADFSLDLAGNYSNMMGYDSFEMRECLRGYLSIHTDHEGN